MIARKIPTNMTTMMIVAAMPIMCSVALVSGIVLASLTVCVSAVALVKRFPNLTDQVVNPGTEHNRQ